MPIGADRSLTRRQIQHQRARCRQRHQIQAQGERLPDPADLRAGSDQQRSRRYSRRTPPTPAVAVQPATEPAKYDVTLIGHRNIGTGVNFYSIEREIALGQDLSRQVEESSKLVTDPAITEYVNRIGQNLVRNSDSRVPFTIKVIDSGEVNAFALPGGFFYVDSGLILAADSEAELAAVMAHEIAHVAARHATKNMTKQQIWNMASIPLMFVGGPAGYAIAEVASIAVPMGFLKFSRDAEREADMLGLQYDYAAGYDPQAFVQFFEKLKARRREAQQDRQDVRDASHEGRPDHGGAAGNQNLSAGPRQLRGGHQRIRGHEGAPDRAAGESPPGCGHGRNRPVLRNTPNKTSPVTRPRMRRTPRLRRPPRATTTIPL